MVRKAPTTHRMVHTNLASFAWLAWICVRPPMEVKFMNQAKTPRSRSIFLFSSAVVDS